MSWDYKTVEVSEDEVKDTLRQLGNAGWELVSKIKTRGSVTTTGIFSYDYSPALYELTFKRKSK